MCGIWATRYRPINDRPFPLSTLSPGAFAAPKRVCWSSQSVEDFLRQKNNAQSLPDINKNTIFPAGWTVGDTHRYAGNEPLLKQVDQSVFKNQLAHWLMEEIHACWRTRAAPFLLGLKTISAWEKNFCPSAAALSSEMQLTCLHDCSQKKYKSQYAATKDWTIPIKSVRYRWTAVKMVSSSLVEWS